MTQTPWQMGKGCREAEYGRERGGACVNTQCATELPGPRISPAHRLQGHSSQGEWLTPGYPLVHASECSSWTLVELPWLIPLINGCSPISQTGKRRFSSQSPYSNEVCPLESDQGMFPLCPYIVDEEAEAQRGSGPGPCSPAHPGGLTSGSEPSVFHTLMKIQNGMHSMEDRAMSQPMP